jgi:hypothetical protein
MSGSHKQAARRSSVSFNGIASEDAIVDVGGSRIQLALPPDPNRDELLAKLGCKRTLDLTIPQNVTLSFYLLSAIKISSLLKPNYKAMLWRTKLPMQFLLQCPPRSLTRTKAWKRFLEFTQQ